MYPTFDKIREMAAGDYKRIPICKELYADSYTPVEMMRILQKASHHCYLLESASQSEAWGRYSFLGYDPSMEITCTDGILRIRKTSKTETFGRSGNAAESSTESSTEEVRQVAHPGDAIREIISQYKSPVMDDMPTFTGGLVGYFSYDYIKYSEPKLELKDKEQQDFRDLDLMLFNDVIAFDHYRQKVLLITGVMTDDLEKSYKQACEKLEEMTELIKKGEKKIFPPIRLKSEIQPQFAKEKYCQMVETAKHYIHEGDIFQVVLSNPMRAKAEGSLFDTYRVLRATNPSPYMFYFSSDDIEIAGASPETLVKLDHGKLSTFPLAGTRPRGKTPEEDKALEADLLQDEKELAEHNMLVDLGRNDIGKISELGSVKVEKYLTVERYSCVMHLGSTVTGTIKKGKDAIDAVDAILPAGTLSGAPKFRACQIIQELEQSKRGIYGGAIGYVDFTGNLDVCIAIRLVYKKKDEICIRSGAGIVADSVPEKEFEECQNKARAGRGGIRMMLLIDNYDSFSYNLYQLIGSVNPDIQVVRNDEISLGEIEKLIPEAIVLSPGPGRPEEAGICIPVIKEFAGKIPILGVCLGHQSICEAFGGVVSYAKELKHGKRDEMIQCGSNVLFKGLPEKFPAARYHSLAAIEETLPEELVVTARAEDGEIMAVEHKEYPVYGVQFHPESVMTPDGRKMIENFLERV